MCSTKWTVIARLAARRTQTRLPGRTFAASPALARWGRRRARACDASVARRTRRGSVHHYESSRTAFLCKVAQCAVSGGPSVYWHAPPERGWAQMWCLCFGVSTLCRPRAFARPLRRARDARCALALSLWPQGAGTARRFGREGCTKARCGDFISAASYTPGRGSRRRALVGQGLAATNW